MLNNVGLARFAIGSLVRLVNDSFTNHIEHLKDASLIYACNFCGYYSSSAVTSNSRIAEDYDSFLAEALRRLPQSSTMICLGSLSSSTRSSTNKAGFT